jgi:hypothetical protein
MEGECLRICQGQDAAPPHGATCHLVGLDRKHVQQGQTLVHCLFVDAAATVGHQQDIRGFRRPQGWHDGTFVRYAIEQYVEVRARLVLEAPGDRDRAIQDEAGHASAPAGIAQFAPVYTTEGRATPQCAETLRRIRRPLPPGIGDRHKTCDRAAVTRNDQLLTRLNAIEQFGQMGLGLKSADLGHFDSTSWSNQCI